MPAYLPSHADLRRNLPEVAIQLIYRGVRHEIDRGPPYVELSAWLSAMSPSEMTPEEIRAVLHATMILRDQHWRQAWLETAKQDLYQRTGSVQDTDDFLRDVM